MLLSPFIKPGTVTETAYNHYSLLRSIEDPFGLAHLSYAAQPGLASFGSDVFTGGASSTATTTTSTTTSTPAPGHPGCVAKHSGGVLGTVAVVKTRAGHALTFVARRNGELSFEIRPAHGPAH